MFCKNCSKDMSANALHCPNCGEPTKSEVLAKEVKPWSMVKLGVILSLTCVFPFVGYSSNQRAYTCSGWGGYCSGHIGHGGVAGS